MRIALFQTPEIMQIAIGEDHKAAVLGSGITALAPCRSADSYLRSWFL